MIRKKWGGGEYGSEDHHRPEGKEGKGIGFRKNAQGAQIEGNSFKGIHLGGNAQGAR